MPSAREALDLLFRDGAISPRQQRRFLKAVDFSERGPGPLQGAGRRLLRLLFETGEPAIYDRLGVRYLAGELDEPGFRLQALRESLAAGTFWVLWMAIFFMGMEILNGNRKQVDPRFLLEFGGLLIVMGFLFAAAMHVPMTAWWVRKRRRLDEITLQQGRAKDV